MPGKHRRNLHASKQHHLARFLCGRAVWSTEGWKIQDWKSSFKVSRLTPAYASGRALAKIWTIIMTDYPTGLQASWFAINAGEEKFPDGEYRFRAENETVYASLPGKHSRL